MNLFSLGSDTTQVTHTCETLRQRGTLFVDHSVMVGEPVNYGIQQIAFLVIDMFNGAAKSALDVLVQEFLG